jgi:hypothetical protein
MLRAVLKKNIKLWEECLPHVEFAYNRSMQSTTKICPLEIVYGLISRAPIDLMPLPTFEKLNFDAKQRAELMLKLHETTKENIEHMNFKYKLAGDKGRKQLIFEHGELVWLHLRKDRFPALKNSKLMPRADGPFKFSVLVLLVLASSSIACRMSALVAGCRAPQDLATIGGGVSVAKAQHPWKAVVGP